MYVLDHAALTHRGTVRELNEDSVLDRPPVFLVADGIGGHEAGEVASALVVAAFTELLDAGVTTGEPGADGIAAGIAIDADTVAATLQRAHGRVRDLHRGSVSADDGHRPGTTACGVVVVDSGGEPYWLCFNVGDSRLYRQTPGADVLTQISVDHSHVQELLDAGVITSEQAAHHPGRHLVTRAVGTQEEVEPDFWMRPLVLGERLLLCTDGLVEDGLTDELTALACAPGSALDTATRLVDLSLASGAKDNVSVVVVQVVGVDPGPEPAHAIEPIPALEHEGAR
ncbi:MAG: PP2C family protein-serine/threonine phosphatase [Propionibacteriaceae bacterium]